jgi:hypothetical protein
MTDPGAAGGYNHATCPTCKQTFVWTVVPDPSHIIRCTNDIKNADNKTTRCPQKYTRSEWEYVASRQRKEE